MASNFKKIKTIDEIIINTVETILLDAKKANNVATISGKKANIRKWLK